MANRNVVHRDLKLDNLMLHFPQGVERRLAKAVLKLGDFGNACECKEGELLTELIGNEATIAPEITQMIKISKKVKRMSYRGDKIDIWAIGIILYWLLTGKPPFFAPEDDERLFGLVHTGEWSWTIPVRDGRLSVSMEAIQMVQACLRNDPD